MKATCVSCSQSFEAKTSRARYCSGKCKKRVADSRRRAPVVQLAKRAEKPAAAVEEPHGIGASLLDTFKAADLASPLGQIAVKVAGDIDQMTPGVPGYAGLVKELVSIVEKLEGRSSAKKASPLMLIRERRAADRAAQG